MVKDQRAEKLLEEIYNSKEDKFNLTDDDKRKIDIIVNNIDSQKAVATALITSLVKKVLDPHQDVRFHKADFGNPEWDRKGYSARTFDTQNITPWMKKRFRKWAMKESAWLTRSLEQPHPFTLDFPGRIKKKDVKKAFLEILNKLEENENINNKGQFAYDLLKYMIFKMKEKHNQQMRIVSYDILTDLKNKRQLTIQHIIDVLDSYFNMKFKQKQGTSYLPVVAIYSLLQVVMPHIERYKGKKLGELKPHTASDRTSFTLGDIEVFNEDGSRFEVFEIKHNIVLRSGDIKDVMFKITKSGESKLKRYYILTTAKPDVDPYELNQIKLTCENFLRNHGVEIIPNAVILTIKYFLRLIENPEEFIKIFTLNLQKIFQEESVLKEEHILKWKEILQKFGFEVKDLESP